MELSSSMDSNAFQPPLDQQPDGPFTDIAVIVTTTVPMQYELRSSVSVGIGAGHPTNIPNVLAAIETTPCFAVGAEPQPGETFCTLTAPTAFVRRADFGGFFASLDTGTLLAEPIGSMTGELPAGTYWIYIRTAVQMDPFFGPGGDANGSSAIILQWEAEPCLPDINGDGIVDTGDISRYVAFFVAGDPMAELNGDGILDLGDIRFFVDLFLEGC